MRPTKQVALDMGCKFIYDEWGRVNLHADKLKMGDTVIVETLPTNGKIDFRFAPIVRTSKTVIFAFMKHCNLDFEGSEVGWIIEEMTNVAKEFIMRLDATGYYEPISESDYMSVINKLDENLAGIWVSLELKELQGECVTW